MIMTPVSLAVTAPGPTTLTVALAGELDMDTAERVEPQLTGLAGRGERELQLDLSGVTFCDSSGTELFVRVPRRCLAAGVRLRLCRVGPVLV